MIIDRALDLPAWVEDLRPAQADSISEILDLYEQGAQVVILDAPTGTGKTLIAEIVRQKLNKRGLYICSTKSLQNQFAKDFPYASVLKGRANYPTMREDLFHGGVGEYSVTAADCTKGSGGDSQQCIWCSRISDCPYEFAKRNALASELSVLNTRYFLTEANGPGRFSKRDFVIFDEADLLESEVMGWSSIEISERRVKEFKLGEPERITKEDAWKEWTKTSRRTLQEISRSVSPPSVGGNDIKQIRKYKYIQNLQASLAKLEQGLEDGGWIYTGKNGMVSFKPVMIDSISQSAIWDHSQKFLLMSGTVISPSQMVQELGFVGNWSFVSTPSQFPKEHRVVKFTPVADVTRKNKERAYPDVARGIKEIIARHPGQRVLVHTVSYDLTEFLRRDLQTLSRGGVRIYSYSSAAERDKALREFTTKISPRETRESTTSVLLAPSMDRGIDLPGDKCRVQVIAKVPFPNLGDRQIAARTYRYGGQSWYNVQTVRTIMQMCGRAVRSEDDWAVTYIIDGQFQQLWNKCRGLFPKWWRDGMDWSDKL